MIVLKIFGWVLLGLLALFVLLMVVPATVKVQYDGTLKVWVRLLFVRVRVFPLKMKPRPAKEKKPKAAKAKKAEETDKKKEKKKRTPQQTAALIRRLVRAGLRAMKSFFGHLRIRAVQLVLPIHADEAADTAVRCGQVQMAIGSVRGVLTNWLNIRFKRIDVIPDFLGRYGSALFLSCKFVFCPGILLVMAFQFLKTYLAGRRPYSKAAYKRALAQKRAAQAAQNGKAA